MRIAGTHRSRLHPQIRGHLLIPAGMKPAANYVKVAQAKRVDPRAWERRLAATVAPVPADMPREEILAWSPLNVPRGLMTSAATTIDLRRIARVVRR